MRIDTYFDGACNSLVVGQYKQRVPFLAQLHEGLPAIPASISAYQMLMEYETRRLPQTLGVSSASTPIDIYREIVGELHQGIRWIRHGLPVFQLSADILAALLLTDPTNVEPEDVRAPFPTFAITVPAGFWRLTDDHGHEADATTVWVHAYDSILKSVATTVTDRTVVGTLRYPHLKLLNLSLCAGDLRLYERRDAIGPATVIGDWLNRDAPDVERPLFDLHETDTEKGYRRTLRRLYVNLCLYLTEHRARRQPRKEPSKKQRRRGTPVPTPEIYIVGPEIKVQPELVGAAKAWVGACRKDRGPWRVQKRFCVRGHYRNQAHGPGRALRTRIWVAPFWKGTGPRLSHLYNLE
jgi:hypothetical protein